MDGLVTPFSASRRLSLPRGALLGTFFLFQMLTLSRPSMSVRIRRESRDPNETSTVVTHLRLEACALKWIEP